MIFSNTLLKVFDNSGMHKVKCIGFVKSKRKYAKLFDVIVLSVRKYDFAKSYSKGDICYGLVMKTCQKFVSFDGMVFSMSANGVMMLSKDFEPLFQRVNTFFLLECSIFGFSKMISLALFLV